MRAKHLYYLAVALALGSYSPIRAQERSRLSEWERGVAVEAPEKAGMAMYLWFYEWTMFDAIKPGQHAQGTFETTRRINPEGTEAVLELPALSLRITAAPGGADLELRVTNTTGYDWPELAAIIPCWSPGRTMDARAAGAAFFHVPRNAEFADPEFKRTFFLSRNGLSPLASRDIHFNDRLTAPLRHATGADEFVFSKKWPTSKTSAKAGLIIREAANSKWVTGIAWEDYLSVQAHNPWNCMHVAVRVGPLKRSQSKIVRGKLYLFLGGRADCLERFRQDFSQPTESR
jgi:hypothetical protein